MVQFTAQPEIAPKLDTSASRTIRPQPKIHFGSADTICTSPILMAAMNQLRLPCRTAQSRKAFFTMNSSLKHLFSIMLLTLTCLPIWAQQTASPIEQSKSTPASESAPRFTADGVPMCTEQLKSRSLPEGVYRVGGDVFPPIPAKAPEATFSDDGRKYARNVMKTQHIKRFEAKSLVGLTVDANGLPQDLCVFNETGHDFDRRAFDAVATYRFRPATLDGKPVPVRLTVEVMFALW